MKRVTERGIGKIGALVAIAIFAAGMWLLFNTIPIYYAYLEIEGQMEAVAKTAQLQTDGEIREFLLQKIKELNIPAESEDLKIERFNGKIHLDLKYEELLSFEWEEKFYDLYTFRFHAHVERDIPEKKR